MFSIVGWGRGVLGSFFERTGNRLHFQLVTEHRWIAGYVHTAHRRLIDFLNSDLAPVISARGVSVGYAPGCPSPDGGPDGGLIEEVTIVADRILFGIPVEAEASAAAPSGPQVWVVKKAAQRAVLGIGPYEICCNVHVPEGAELTQAFLTSGLEFFAATDALIRRLDGSVNLEERVVVVNRKRVDFAHPAASAPPWARFGGQLFSTAEPAGPAT